jgi:hypothetical protein
MSNRLTGAILLLYPRVREGHGPEIVALVDDLIAHEGRSRTGLFIRLAVDGLVQRIASTATLYSVVAVLVATSFGGLAVADFAAANVFQVVPRTVRTVAPAWHTHQTPHHLPRWHRTSGRPAGMIARRLRHASSRLPTLDAVSIGADAPCRRSEESAAAGTQVRR